MEYCNCRYFEGKRTHLPSKQGLFKCKSFVRGYSKTLYNGDITLTYWNDNNAACIVKNNIESGEEHWELIEVKGKSDRPVIHVPKVAAHYKDTYGWVHRTNQQLSYYNTEHRAIRKQGKILESMIEMYALNNMHTLWINSPELEN